MSATDRNGGAAWDIRERRDPLTGQRLKTCRHAGGMTLLLLPKPRFSRRFFGIAVPYGAVHTRFTDGEPSSPDRTATGPGRRSAGNRHSVPPGTAHYLEHCVFGRGEDGGLSGRISALGGQANAYTTHGHTLYHVTAVSRILETAEQMLRAVLVPDLDADRVEAERPIILSEIDMYRDDPDTRLYMELLQSLFHRHPIRQDIGGRPDTVSRITAADLEGIRRRFHHPSRLVLSCAGDIDESRLLEQLDRIVAECGWERPAAAVLPAGREPGSPRARARRVPMEVREPAFLVGIKDPGVLPDHPLPAGERALRSLAGRLFFESLLGPSSPLFDVLFHEGLVNESFAVQYQCEPDVAFLLAGGESGDPDRAVARIRDLLPEAVAAGPAPSLFDIQKRAAAGHFIRSLDAVESCGLAAARSAVSGIDLFDYPAFYDRIDLSGAIRSMRFASDPDAYAEAILEPTGGIGHDGNL